MSDQSIFILCVLLFGIITFASGGYLMWKFIFEPWEKDIQERRHDLNVRKYKFYKDSNK